MRFCKPILFWAVFAILVFGVASLWVESIRPRAYLREDGKIGVRVVRSIPFFVGERPEFRITLSPDVAEDWCVGGVELSNSKATPGKIRAAFLGEMEELTVPVSIEGATGWFSESVTIYFSPKNDKADARAFANAIMVDRVKFHFFRPGPGQE